MASATKPNTIATSVPDVVMIAIPRRSSEPFFARSSVSWSSTSEWCRPGAAPITDNPSSIAYFGGWRTFSEDEQIRATASVLLD